MAGKEIVIYLQNVVGYLEFLMRYQGFWHNQTFEPFCIYKENEKHVYNKMHSDK